MTEALIKPLKLRGKDCDRLVKEAFSEENRKRVEHFNKYERPKLQIFLWTAEVLPAIRNLQWSTIKLPPITA